MTASESKTLLQEMRHETAVARAAAIVTVWWPWLLKKMRGRLVELGFTCHIGYAKGACVFQRHDDYNTLFVAWNDTTWLEVQG